jgi:hypothetical protein
MTTQMLWIAIVVFAAGLFLGSNLGVLLMCVLHMSGREQADSDDLVSNPVPVENQYPVR